MLFGSAQALSFVEEDGVFWYRPSSLDQLQDLMAQHGSGAIKYVGGGTGNYKVKGQGNVEQGDIFLTSYLLLLSC